jgi:hypothetical protein
VGDVGAEKKEDKRIRLHRFPIAILGACSFMQNTSGICCCAKMSSNNLAWTPKQVGADFGEYRLKLFSQ